MFSLLQIFSILFYFQYCLAQMQQFLFLVQNNEKNPKIYFTLKVIAKSFHLPTWQVQDEEFS